MRKKCITLVTAFFDIGRKEWNGFERDNEKYFDYFTYWSSIQNKLIVFVENPEHKERILKIRERLSKTNNTIVIITGNIEDIDSNLYNCIDIVSESRIQKDFHLFSNNPESYNSKYNYVVALKLWCLREAVIYDHSQSDYYVWIDFGFAHGNEVYIDSKEFNFFWEYDFGEGIHLGGLRELDDRPIFDIVRSMDAYIMGSMFAGDAKSWLMAWDLMKNMIYALAECGLMDDDQTLLLMMARKYKELIHVDKTSGWHLFLKEHGASHLTTREKPLLKKMISKMRIAKMRLYIRRQINIIKYLFRQNKYLLM